MQQVQLFFGYQLAEMGNAQVVQSICLLDRRAKSRASCCSMSDAASRLKLHLTIHRCVTSQCRTNDFVPSHVR